MISEVSIRSKRLYSELSAHSVALTTMIEDNVAISSEVNATTRQLDMLLIEAKQDVSSVIWLRAGTSQHIHNNLSLLSGLGVDSDNELTLNGKKVYDGSKNPEIEIPTTPTGGDSFWVEDENGDLVPKSKEDGTARGVKVKKLYIPNSDGSEIIYQIYVGELGEGADIPSEGGGGTADFSQIKVYDTNGILLGNGASDGKITITPYPVVPTKVSAFENDEGFLKEEDISGLTARVSTAETNIINLGTRADGLQGDIEDVQDDVTTILNDYLSKANGGIIKGAVTIQAALKMNTLYLPNSNNTPSDYTLSIGSLGSGSDTPEGGGGIAQVTINVNGSPYKTDANGVVTLPNYPTSLPASDVYAWAKAATKPTYTASEIGALSEVGGVVRGTVVISGNDVTNVPLNIATPSMGYTGYIRFGATFTTYELGHLGFSAKGVPAMVYEGTVNTLYHTGNFNPANYLPLSGGTLTAYDSPLALSSTSARVFQLFKVGDSNKGSIGYANGLMYIGNDTGNYARIGVNDSGIPQYWSDNNAANAHTLIHSGNIGSQNVASAVIVRDNDGCDVISYTGGHPLFGFGKSEAGYDSVICGNNIILSYGTTHITGLTLNSSGNVLIGTTTDNGAKLNVNGNISASGYQLPTSAPSNPVSGGYYLYVGTLGSGAVIS